MKEWSGLPRSLPFLGEMQETPSAVERVHIFLGAAMAPKRMRAKKGIAAWLVTWEGLGDRSKMKRKVAAILNPHWSPRRVLEYVEFIYVINNYSIDEQIAYAKNKSFNPYPAEFNRIRGVPWDGQIICGHNPFLYARLVDDLQSGGGGGEDIVWKDRPKPDFDKIFRDLETG